MEVAQNANESQQTFPFSTAKLIRAVDFKKL